ncbi:MAG: DUF3574 domain-containing protein [Dokdonella sp.]|uniref:DUF3574 domain-containing protein n=1 Tax=Dokdonella sp. TaxID=2291710 RepID=UPI003F7EB5CF
MRVRPFARAGLAGALAALAGCHAEWVRDHPLGCGSDEQSLLRDTLYFGRATPGGGEVDEANWQRFEAEVLAHAFPRGYTTFDARGHWLGHDGVAVSEASRVLVVVHDRSPSSDAALRAVVAAYRERFRQEAVLRERTVACVAF